MGKVDCAVPEGGEREGGEAAVESEGRSGQRNARKQQRASMTSRDGSYRFDMVTTRGHFQFHLSVTTGCVGEGFHVSVPFEWRRQMIGGARRGRRSVCSGDGE